MSPVRITKTKSAKVHNPTDRTTVDTRPHRKIGPARKEDAFDLTNCTDEDWPFVNPT
ncbi:MAG: hypothetical protein AAF581_06620 [Planctomycetota bacterium]